MILVSETLAAVRTRVLNELNFGLWTKHFGLGVTEVQVAKNLFMQNADYFME